MSTAPDSTGTAAKIASFNSLQLHGKILYCCFTSRAATSLHLLVLCLVLLSMLCLFCVHLCLKTAAALDRHCRFHELLEFDDQKRSCRRRLAGHNERRRKSSAEANGGDGCRHADQDGRSHPGNPPLNHFQIR